MPRSARDSEEEPETSAARKRPSNLLPSGVDSPLRRSLRVQQSTKHIDTSPESVASDVSGVQTRITRRRAGTMDSTGAEKRTLRSRKTSGSSEISETADSEVSVGTPSKRLTRRSVAAVTSADTPKKSSARTSGRRFARAGSETRTSPPPARVTRKTRANSVDPESVKDFKLKELHVELPNTPINTRNRASIAPSESPVEEEVEEEKKIPVITLEDTLIEVEEPNDAVHSYSKVFRSKEVPLLSPIESEQSSNKSDNKTFEERDSKSSDNSNANETSPLAANKTAISDDINTTEKSPETSNKLANKDGNSSSEISSVGTENLLNISNEFSDFDEPSKKLGSNTEELSKKSVKEEELNNSNKENENINIINEIQPTKEIISANVTLTSPKPLVPDLSYKTIKEKDRLSTGKELLQNRSIKESSESTKITNKTSDMEVGVSIEKSSANLSQKDVETTSNSQSSTERKLSCNDFETEAALLAEKIKTADEIAVERTDEKMEIDETMDIDEKMDICEETEKKQINTDDERKIENKESKNVTNNTIDTKLTEVPEKKIDDEETKKLDIDKDIVPEKTSAYEDIEHPEKMDIDEESSWKETDIDATIKMDVSEEKKDSDVSNEDQDADQDNNNMQTVEESLNKPLANETSEIELLKKEKSEIQNNEDSNEKSEDKDVSMKTLDSKEDNSKTRKSSSSIEVLQSDEEGNAPRLRTDSVSSIETVVLISCDTDLCRNTTEGGEIVSETTITEQTDSSVTIKVKEKSDDLSEPIFSQSSESIVNANDMCTDKTDSDFSNVKSTQSSIVTETREETTKEIEKELDEDTKKPIESTVEKEKETEKRDDPETAQKVIEEDNKLDESSDSDVNIVNLFQNILADEWKGKSKNDKESGDDSERSLPPGRREHESETECDLVLVDKNAWMEAERLKAAKEKESFDYDSDDTVVMKSRMDSMIESDDENLNLSLVKEETKEDSDEESEQTPSKQISKSEQKVGSAKKLNVSNKSLTEKSESQLNKSSKLNLSQKSIKISPDLEPVEKMQLSSDELEDEDMNLSQPSLLRKKKLSKSSNENTPNTSLKKKKELKDQNSASKKLRVPKVQIEKMDCEESMESDNNDNLTETPSGRPSMNISNRKTPKSESNKKARNISLKKDSNDTKLEDVETSGKRSMSKYKFGKVSVGSNEEESSDSMNLSIITMKRRSLNLSSNKKSSKDSEEKETDELVSSQKTSVKNESGTEESSDEGLKQSSKKKTSKKSFSKNYSTLVHIGSDSDEGRQKVSESSDSENNIARIPKFLFNEASSEEEEDKEEEDKTSDEEKISSASMDSDIEREYNLKGKNISKYSDDGVPGDDCRASESEYSDPDDNGSDLADFVIDDEDVEEEEEEEEENEESEEEEEDKAEEEDQEIIVDDEENDEEKDEEKMKNDRAEDQKDEKMSVDDEEGSIDAKFSSEEEIVPEETDTKQKMKDKETGELAKKLAKASISQKIRRSSSELSSSLQEKGKAVKETNTVKNISFESSLSKGKKSHKQQEFEKQLNESDFIFTQKLNKYHGIECSTPKAVMKGPGKLVTSLLTSSTTSDSKTKSETDTITLEQENLSAKKKSVKDTSLNVEKILKESKNLENDSSLIHRSLPAKSNLNKEAKKLQKSADLHQTQIVMSSDLTLQYLRKSRLNESAPVMMLKEDTSKGKRQSLEKVKKSQDEPKKVIEVDEDVENVDVVVAGTKRKHKKSKIPKEDEKNVEVIEETYQKNITVKSEKLSLTSSNSEDVDTQEKKKKKKKKIAKKLSESPELPFDDVIEEADEDIAAIKIDKKKKKKKSKINEILEDEPALKKKKKLKQKKVQEKIVKELTEKKKKRKHELISEQPEEKSGSSKKSSKKQKVQTEKIASDSDEIPERISFSKTETEVLQPIKRIADSIKTDKETKKKKKQKEHIQRMQEEKETKEQKPKHKLQRSPIKTRSHLKRLPEDILDDLSDIPVRPKKKQKLQKKEQQVRPSRSMFTLENPEMDNINVKESNGPLSFQGSTTEFEVTNLASNKQNIKKQAVASFRQKMLARNSRQPMSSYLMYLQKQKASGKK